jgi:hypothetical protein
MRRVLLGLLFIGSVYLPMLGQTDKVEVFGGYSFERIAPGCGGGYTCGPNYVGETTNFRGWAASVTGYFTHFGLTGQIAGNYNGDVIPIYASAHRYTYQVGPTYAFRMQRLRPFAHALFGGVTEGEGPRAMGNLGYSDFILSLGGGLDIKVSKRFSIRAAQVDYERQLVPVVGSSQGTPTYNPGATSGANGLRYSAGIVVRF